MKLKEQFKLRTILLFVVAFGLVFTACKDDDPEPDKSSAKAISTFTFAGLTPPVAGAISGTNISVTVPGTTDVTALTPTIVISDLATVSPNTGVAQDFSAPVTYTVTAEDGSAETYTVTVRKENVVNDEAELVSFVFAALTPPVDGTINGTDIAVTVPFDVDVTSLVPTIVISTSASVSPDTGEAQDFTSPVVYTVTAEDGTTAQAYTVTVTKEAAPAIVITPVWEKTLANGDLPSWFTANNDSEVAHSGDFVFVQNNRDKIRVLDKTTGEEATADEFIDGTENYSGGSGLFANLLGIDVDDMGNIVGSTGTQANGAFRIYRWDDKDAEQELLLSGNYASRLGDNISVVGDVYADATIFAPSQGSSSIYKFTVTGGVANDVPEIITTETALGNGTGVYSISGSAASNLIATGTGLSNIVELNQEGNIVAQIPSGLFSDNDSIVYQSLTAITFELNGRKLIASTATDWKSTSKVGKFFIIDYTNGWDNITAEDVTAVSFTPEGSIDANVNATGGVAVEVDGNTATVYAMITNFGVGAYTITYE